MSGLLSAYDEMLVNMEKTVCVLDPKGEYREKTLGSMKKAAFSRKGEWGSRSCSFREVSVRGIYGYV